MRPTVSTLFIRILEKRRGPISCDTVDCKRCTFARKLEGECAIYEFAKTLRRLCEVVD